ncbi:GNAT family N-acetyltransferase [uncultured Tenacibaculum sp.]|uniref:GNAT family N-acetyltransferase n=1 Tax=uncultured Tenacibaculum sp. TaxID=174713 RepID=UPI0026360AC7|nr:GNAT family N-acetyltransferase [uncultured Tenacibaculum sp.]
MHFFKTNSLNLSQKEALKNLWNAEYPKIIQHKTIDDFDRYLNSLSEVNHTLVLENNNILGWFACFLRDKEQWFLMILNHKYQGKGIGKQLIEKAKQEYTILNGWVVCDNDYKKVDGTTYKSPVGFYKKLGFTFFEDITLDASGLKAIKIQLKR